MHFKRGHISPSIKHPVRNRFGQCNELHFQSIAHMQFRGFFSHLVESSFVVFQVLGHNNIVVCVFFANCYIKIGLRQQTSSVFVIAAWDHAKEIIGVGFLISVWTYAQQC